MTQWEYCEVDFNGSTTFVWFYDEACDYIDSPTKRARLGIVLAKLGHDSWELVSTWWRSKDQVIDMLKRPCQSEWIPSSRIEAEQKYLKQHPKDARY
jgi:hypothetical protein